MRYWSGFATGVSVLALVFFGAIDLLFLPGQIEMYKQFKSTALPPATKLVLSPTWHIVVPLLAALAVVALNAARIASEARRATGLAVMASILIGTLLFTWWAMYLPIFELAVIDR